MEVTIANRRFKMIDGEIRIREFNNKGEETKKEIWKLIKFSISRGYHKCNIRISGKDRQFKKHRLMYKLHNPDWDILDSSRDNCIDHINGDRLDNRIENLRVVTHQQNNWNRLNVKGYRLTAEGNHQAYIYAKLIYHIIL